MTQKSTPTDAAPIQLFVPTFDVEGCLKEIRECLEIGWTGMGFKTAQFESAWKTYTGLPHAHFLASNTIGLHLAMKILKNEFGWKDGDEVISTSLTFVSTNHAILYENLRPVFADVDESLCLSPESIRQRITPRTKAVIYVGFGGNTGRFDEVLKLCREKGLKLILDAAHMAGSRLHGKHVGAEADVTVFSFQAVKNLPTGDSGMICFQDAELDSIARKMSWLGINSDTYARSGGQEKGRYKWLYDVEYVGMKGNGNSIMAAIGLTQLKLLDRDNEFRRRLASQYREALQGSPQIRFVPVSKGCETSQHLFQIRVDRTLRDELILALNAKGIHPGVHYRVNTEYKMYAYGKGSCPQSDLAALELVSLPLHLRLTPEDVARVSREVLSFLETHSGAKCLT